MRFSKINIFTSNALFILALIGSLAFMNFETFKNIGQTPIFLPIFLLLCDLLMIGLLIWGVTSKITISDNEIRYKSIFKDITIEWNQIKSYGVFVTGRYVKTVIDKKDYDKFILAGQKFIYITDNGNFVPDMFKNRPKSGFKYIDFHYRKGIIDMIEEKLNSKQLPL